MFSIKEIINGNEILVKPNWFFKGYEGDKVYIDGFRAPSDESGYGYSFAKKKLTSLLSDKEFGLHAPEFWEKFGKDKIVCHVYLNDVDIKNYFPEFK